MVIPALDAADTIAATLASARDADELVVVDGGSRDATAAVAESAGARLVRSERGRGVQLHAGALAARGDWLLFLHADTRLAAGWREAAARHMRGASPGVACFRLRLDAEEWQGRIVEAGVRLRVRLLGLPYGDQGLLVPRSLYDELGGFRPLPLMEDVDFVRRASKRGLAVLPVPAITSAERWRRDGWLRRSARNLACLALYQAGVAPVRLARFYG